jgi:hypothetical protein
MTETAYNNWIHEQLEPEDRLPHHRRDIRPYTSSEITRVYKDQIDDLQQEQEDNTKQDAYLKTKGI